MVYFYSTLALVNCIIEATASPTIAPALAHGQIRNFEIGIAVVACLNLPISFFALKYGYPPQTTVIISILLSTVAIFVRVLFLKKMMQFPVKKYLLVLLRSCLALVTSYSCLLLIAGYCDHKFGKLILTSTTGLILITLTFWFVITKDDRREISSVIATRLKK